MEQHKINAYKTRRAICVFRDKGEDLVELKEMLNYLQWHCIIFRYTRIGLSVGSQLLSKYRPLNNSGDANLVLSSAK